MKNILLENLAQKSLAGEILTSAESQAILESSEFTLLAVIDAAYQVRKKYFSNEVLIHILDNVQNGGCSEDCRYCAQSCQSTAEIVAYPQKSDAEILAEAQQSYQAGAFRHCLVFSGERLLPGQIENLIQLIREMKRRFPMEICVSAGFLDAGQARALKTAGLDRINHNLNTSRRNYSNICTTHTYEDREKTIQAARSVGLDVCSGVIVGMGETKEDVIAVAMALRELEVASIPVNFLLPIPGIALPVAQSLTPEYCLRVLCLFRFLNPHAEIRIAAGREYHLRSLEALALYPANSLFLDGYLNAQGSSRSRTLQMIKDAGFTICCEQGIDALLKNEKLGLQTPLDNLTIKTTVELRSGKHGRCGK